MNDKPEDIFIVPGAASCVASTLPPTVWISDNFAQDWFADAVRESKIPQDHNARRREIIFAVCFLESYIFEWTRQTLNSDELNNYFPLRHKPRRNLRAKWDKIPKDLYTDNKIRVQPKLDLSGLETLLKYRHGLIHAAASRPAIDLQSEESRPFPTKDMLAELPAGWAVNIGRELVKALHDQLDEPCPEFIRATGTTMP